MKKPSRDLVGTQSGPHGTAFGQSGSSRDPVGHQFSNFWHHVWTCREAAKITQKHAKTLQKCYFLWIWLPPDIGARLDPDWIPTGSRLAKSGAQKCKNWCPTGSRRDPDEIPTGSIDRQGPTPAPIFPFPDPPLPLFSFSARQPCTNTPPLLHQNGKSSLKPNGGSTIYTYIMCASD